MKELLETLEKLKQSSIQSIIEDRMQQFSKIKKMDSNQIFKELCFCIMTANCGAEKCIEIHENIGELFNYLNQSQLAQKFKDLGYRFPNVRSQYIVEARTKLEELHKALQDNREDLSLREWLVKNIRGIGYKEGSHFLRNIGFTKYAIIDFHIVDLLVKNKLIEKPKTMTKQKYLEIEYLLKQMADRLNLNLAELDLYLWFLETGKVLK